MRNEFLLTFLFAAMSGPAGAWDDGLTADSTFSIIARDVAAGELGIAVQSKAHAIGSRAISAKGGLAVIAHQAVSDPMYGQIGLELLQRGYSPQQALDFMVRGDEGRDNRQVAILDMQGRTASSIGMSVRGQARRRRPRPPTVRCSTDSGHIAAPPRTAAVGQNQTQERRPSSGNSSISDGSPS
jgi:hypothetical protein